MRNYKLKIALRSALTKKIEAIKYFRDFTGCGLVQAKEVVERFGENNFEIILTEQQLGRLMYLRDHSNKTGYPHVWGSIYECEPYGSNDILDMRNPG